MGKGPIIIIDSLGILTYSPIPSISEATPGPLRLEAGHKTVGGELRHESQEGYHSCFRWLIALSSPRVKGFPLRRV